MTIILSCIACYIKTAQNKPNNEHHVWTQRQKYRGGMDQNITNSNDISTIYLFGVSRRFQHSTGHIQYNTIGLKSPKIYQKADCMLHLTAVL